MASLKTKDDLKKYLQGKNEAEKASAKVRLPQSNKKTEQQKAVAKSATAKQTGLKTTSDVTSYLKKQNEKETGVRSLSTINKEANEKSQKLFSVDKDERESLLSQLKNLGKERKQANNAASKKEKVAAFNQHISNLQESDKTYNYSKKNSTIPEALASAYDDESYADKIARGDMVGGLVSGVAEALQLPQSLGMNALNNIHSLANGGGTVPYVPKMSYSQYEQATKERTGEKPFSEMVSDRFGSGAGTAARIAMEFLTDPLLFLDAGVGVAAKAGKVTGTAKYAELLRAGKLPEQTAKVLSGTAKVMDSEIENIAEELATQPEQTREEILKAFKENGYVTDAQHARLAELSNIKRGKNVETPSVIDNKAAKLGSSTKGLLTAPEKESKTFNVVQKPLKNNSAEAERSAQTLLGDFYTRQAAQDLEDAYDTVKNVWKTDYLTNNQVDTLLNEDSKINTRYGVNIGEKLNALDNAVLKDKNVSIAEKVRVLDETGVGKQLYGDDWDTLVKTYNGDASQTFHVESLPKELKGQNAAMTDEAIARSQEKLWGERLPNATEQKAAESTETKLAQAAEERKLDEIQKNFKSVKVKSKSDIRLKPAAKDTEIPVSKDTDLPLNRTTVTEVPKTSKTVTTELNDTLDALSKGESVGKIKGTFRKLYKNFVSGTEAVERFAKQQAKVGEELTANELTQAVRTKAGTVDTILERKLVDKAGNVVNDKSFVQVMGQVPEQDLDLFNEYVQNLHNIDRWAQGKPLFKQISAEESEAKVAEILAQHPEFAQYQKDLNNWWNDFTQAWYVDTGVWSQETADYVRSIYPNYVPGYRVGHDIKPGDTNSIITKIGSLKRAKGGESEVIPIQDSFIALINQAVSKGRKNELYTNIIETLEKHPDDFKTFGAIGDTNKAVDPLSVLDEVDAKDMEEVREGVYKLVAYVNGEEKSAYIAKDMRDALRLTDDVYGGSEALKLAHDIASPLSNLRKTVITGLNPVFGTANLLRDVPTYYLQSQAGPLKATSSLFKAAKEMAKKGDLYESYKALGGKQAGYYVQGKGFSDVMKSFEKSGLQKLKDKSPAKLIEAYNEALETLPRLAEYITLVEKYGDNYVGRMKALEGAADVTVNFSRSAPITKAADGWIMYLNASAQGLDKFARQVKNRPLSTATKAGVLMTLPYAALYTVNKDNPHYQDLTDRVKQNYFVIPNLTGEKDSDGYAKTFYKVPLNREYGAIMASSLDLAFSYFEEGVEGLESAANSYKETLGTNFVPPGIDDNVLSFVGEINKNEDYAGQKIVPTYYEDASPQYQTDINTSGIANTLAGLAQQSKILPEKMKSPMNVDYALSQMGYPGQLAQAFTSQQVGSLGERAYNTAVQPFVDRFTADPRKSSGVVSRFYDDLNESETKVKDMELSGEVEKGYSSPEKKYKNALSATSTEISDLMKEEKKILADKSLTTAEKKQKSNEIREQRNELARNATKEANEAQKEYEKIYVKELSDLDEKWQEEYQSIKGSVSATKYKSGYNAQKGVKGGDVAKALKVYDETGETALMTQYGITESGAAKAQKLVNAQVAYEDYIKMKTDADTDGNGYVKTAEAKAYLNSSGYSRKQKAALYEALTSAKKNPYR